MLCTDCMTRQIVESIEKKSHHRADGKSVLRPLVTIAVFTHPTVDEDCMLAIVDRACVDVINLTKLRESTQNGREVFKEREEYVLLSLTRGKLFGGSRKRYRNFQA